MMFPAAAALGWAVLIYIGIDFGFWGKVFDMSAGAERIWRACGEAILSATLLVFLFAYLNLNRWHVRYAHITIGWLVALAALIARRGVRSGGRLRHRAHVARRRSRCSGLALVVYLSTHGFDRAVLLIPTWLLLVVWTFAAGLAVTGVVTNDIIGPALLGGLVLIVMLIGFTVMQHAFAGGITHGIVSDVERRALALTGAGDMIWDWDVSADKVFTSPETEQLLGLKRGALEGPAAHWLDVLHPLDRDRFRAALDSVVEQRRGRLHAGIPPARRRRPLSLVLAQGAAGGRLRRRGGAPGRHAHRRDRFQECRGAAAVRRGARQPHRPAQPRTVHRPHGGGASPSPAPIRSIRPSVMVIDIDRFKQVNDSVGIAVGDSILLTIARRLARLLKPQDTLARLSRRPVRADPAVGDASRRASSPSPRRMRRTLRAPITFNDREIFLTASIGLALADSQPHRTEEVLKDAELAMYHAKRIGGDRIEVFKPAMRSRKTDRLTLESELRRAIEREEIKVLYQPIVRLEDRAIAGFEALARWDHPKLGRLSPAEFISIAEEIGLIVDLGLFVLERTARQLATWQRGEPRPRAAVRQRQRVVAAVAAPRPDPGPAQRAGAHRRSRAARSSSS